jgi:hypothetical protein
MTGKNINPLIKYTLFNCKGIKIVHYFIEKGGLE